MSIWKFFRSAPPKEQISSEAMSTLIVDALIDANIVQKKDATRAIEIASAEIDVRKELGDY